MGTQETQGERRQRLDRAWLRAALAFGLTMSKDPERKVGACVVAPGDRRVSFGYNGLPAGVPDTPENWRNPMKAALVKHAEENACSNASFDLTGAACFCTLKLCHGCMGTLVNNGVRRLVYLDDPVRWKYEDQAAYDLVVMSARIEVVVYPFTPVEVGLLEMYGAVPRGYSMYGADDEHRYVTLYEQLEDSEQAAANKASWDAVAARPSRLHGGREARAQRDVQSKGEEGGNAP